MTSSYYGSTISRSQQSNLIGGPGRGGGGTLGISGGGCAAGNLEP